MDVLVSIVTSKIFLLAFLSWICAQILKLLLYFRTHRRINLRLLVGAGGMPSAHSALVSSLATSIGLTEGWDSTLFLLSLALALIIMTDATGVRRAAGQQAAILNEMMDDFYQHHPIKPGRLKELLGHTPVQVIVGAVLGIILTSIFY
jgi:acid phosphatase family membrane protein YuiD